VVPLAVLLLVVLDFGASVGVRVIVVVAVVVLVLVVTSEMGQMLQYFQMKSSMTIPSMPSKVHFSPVARLLAASCPTLHAPIMHWPSFAGTTSPM